MTGTRPDLTPEGVAQLEALLPVPDFPGGFIIADAKRERFRILNEWGGPDWTYDRAAALRFARRADAEMACREDDAAWGIIPVHATHSELVQALKTALAHLDHMAAWIADQAPNGYTFEGYSEDRPALRAALDKASAL